jgi:hypothetical protein
VTGASAAAIVVLVLLKTAMDLGFHLREHGQEVTEAVGPTPTSTREAPL